MLNYKLLVLFLLTFLVGCTVTGPADDGFENSQEWVDNGRLLSNGTKVVYSTEEKSEQKHDPNKAIQNPDGNPELKAGIDYAAYKQWLEARDQNSSEYQKFRKWQEFEEFQRWKEQQKTE